MNEKNNKEEEQVEERTGRLKGEKRESERMRLGGCENTIQVAETMRIREPSMVETLY